MRAGSRGGGGSYGTKAAVKIPPIVGGAASLTGFKATIFKKTWVYKGRKPSLLTATCSAGSLIAQGAFKFVNGMQPAGEIAKSC